MVVVECFSKEENQREKTLCCSYLWLWFGFISETLWGLSDGFN